MAERKHKLTRAKDVSSEHQRVGVFVDAQNMYHSAKNLYKAKLNFKKVLETLKRLKKLQKDYQQYKQHLTK